MKYLVSVLTLVIVLVSCSSDPTDIEAHRLVGDFFRVKENGRGGNAKDEKVEQITFRSKYCNFTYNGTPMSGKYSVDEGYVYIEAGGKVGTLSLEIINENQLEGEGIIHGTFGREGFESEVVDVEGTGRYKGGSSANENDVSDGMTSNHSSESASNADEENKKSSAAAQESSTSSNTSKTGSSTSNTSAEPAVAKRYVVKHLNTSNMRAGAGAKISLICTINAQGMVVETKLDKSKTTTNNEVLVNSVTAAVKKEVRYNEVAGSGYQKVNYLVKL